MKAAMSKRFREMMGMKQDALAYELGEDWNQQKVSLLEQKETIDVSILEQVAKILNVPVVAFQNFDETQAVNIIANTVNNNDNTAGNVSFNYYPTLNPIEKWIEALAENKNLYERLLESEREKTQLLKEMLEKKK